MLAAGVSSVKMEGINVGELVYMNSRTVTVFIPCLVEEILPDVGVALVNLLRRLGYGVRYESGMACCGQPAFNAGHEREARAVASAFIDATPGEGIIVSPSGSCTAMIRCFYRNLFPEGAYAVKAASLGARVLELSEFLAREGVIEQISGIFSGKVGFHHSCHAARELKIPAPESLLERICGYERIEIEGPQVCCGFGGLFSIKFSKIAANIAKTRLEMFCEKGAEVIVSNDPGCIMHMKKEASELRLGVRILHLAEFLAESMGLSREL